MSLPELTRVGFGVSEVLMNIGLMHGAEKQSDAEAKNVLVEDVGDAVEK